MALWGYFDESGEHDAEGELQRLTLGGFFAPWSSVEKLCISWRDALDDEGLSEFHMKEIASDEHAYDAWPQDRRRRLDRFVDILCDHAIHFGAFSYRVTGPSHAFKDAYEMGLARVMMVTASLSERSGERGHIVFAKTAEIKQELIGRYFDRLGWEEYLDGWTVQSSGANPALQAAEIVARGMKRLMQDGEITHSFRRVVEAKKPIRFWPENPFGQPTF